MIVRGYGLGYVIRARYLRCWLRFVFRRRRRGVGFLGGVLGVALRGFSRGVVVSLVVARFLFWFSLFSRWCRDRWREGFWRGFWRRVFDSLMLGDFLGIIRIKVNREIYKILVLRRKVVYLRFWSIFIILFRGFKSLS